MIVFHSKSGAPSVQLPLLAVHFALMDSQIQPVILIRSTRLRQLLAESTWCPDEAPLVLASCKFAMPGKKYKSGYIMITFGAIYVFQSFWIQNPLLRLKLHLFDCNRITSERDRLRVFMQAFTVKLKVKNVTEILRVIAAVMHQCTWNLKHISLPSIESPDFHYRESNHERPNSAFKKRFISLAHFYDKKGTNISLFSYFDAWETSRCEVIRIGPHFRPGNFTSAAGHAIAWETAINTLVISKFKARLFDKFIEAVLFNAVAIRKLVFHEYQASEKCRFSMTEIPQSHVKQYGFTKCSGSFCSSFMRSMRDYRGSIEDIAFVECEFGPKLGKTLFLAARLECIEHLRTVSFIRTTSEGFPYDRLSQFCELCYRMRCFTAQELNIDGSRLLTALCQPRIHVKIIKLWKMNFAAPISISRMHMSSDLVLLSVSESSFTPAALRSLFEMLIHDWNTRISVMVQMRSLRIREQDLDFLSELEIDKAVSNVSEWDWSENRLPSNYARPFFAYLFTQKKLRVLLLNNVVIDPRNQKVFFEMLRTFVLDLPLIGLDLSGHFSPKCFTEFVNSLTEAKWMRRLCLRCRNGGNEVIRALSNLVESIACLSEISIDGSHPDDRELLFSCWKKIYKHSGIKANDYPISDMKHLGESPELWDKDFPGLRQRPNPSEMQQRADFIIEQMNNQEDTDISSSGDIFSMSSSMQLESTDMNSLTEVPPMIGISPLVPNEGV